MFGTKQFASCDMFPEIDQLIMKHKQLYENFQRTYSLSQKRNAIKMWFVNDESVRFSTSVVYFIKNEYTGLVKIGQTTNLKQRIHQLKQGYTLLGMESNKLVLLGIAYCPFGIKAVKAEHYYHDLFKEQRVIGEWFRITEEDLCRNIYIDKVIQNTFITIEDDLDYDIGLDTICVENDEKRLRNYIRELAVSNEPSSEMKYATRQYFVSRGFGQAVITDIRPMVSVVDVMPYIGVSEDDIEKKLLNIIKNILNEL